MSVKVIVPFPDADEFSMPSHIKSSLLGASLTVPIKDGVLALGSVYFSGSLVGDSNC